jgi:hypothetical protein
VDLEHLSHHPDVDALAHQRHYRKIEWASCQTIPEFSPRTFAKSGDNGQNVSRARTFLADSRKVLRATSGGGMKRSQIALPGMSQQATAQRRSVAGDTIPSGCGEFGCLRHCSRTLH